MVVGGYIPSPHRFYVNMSECYAVKVSDTFLRRKGSKNNLYTQDFIDNM